ncbi:hypothetical protein D3C72_2369610 [compost metagenome]
MPKPVKSTVRLKSLLVVLMLVFCPLAEPLPKKEKKSPNRLASTEVLQPNSSKS